jgi:acetoin utilization deacetylase AcuC-like enzyme
MKPVVLDCPAGTGHTNGHGHPESPERQKALETLFENMGHRGEISFQSIAPSGEIDFYEGPHTPAYLRLLSENTSDPDFPSRLDPDTGLSRASLPAIRASAAALSKLVSAYRNGGGRFFVSERPPGHHALPDRAMGFCLVNHIATLAWRIRSSDPDARIAIFDFDVHHGNGTEAMMRDIPGILFISTHQYPFYPGSGSGGENRSGPSAEGILDIPLPEGTGDKKYMEIFHQAVVPRIERFKPTALLVSAGFDAHKDDPLGGLALTEETYNAIGQTLAGMGPEFIASVLEGGYNLSALVRSVEAYLQGQAAA